LVPPVGQEGLGPTRPGEIPDPRGSGCPDGANVPLVNADTLVAAAVEDLFRIVEYIRKENPSAAQRIAKTIYEVAGSLEFFPHMGRTGRVESTRELPLPPLPFVLVCRIAQDAVEIANVIHGAQRWPPRE
jgi:toxin ParE1/3/4